MIFYKRTEFWLLTVFVLVFVLILPFVPIVDGDTLWYVRKALRMLNTGDFFNLRVLTAKPVLGMWALALSLKIFGVKLFGVYFWHTLFGAGTLALLYRFATKHFGKDVSFWSTGILLTALMFFYQTASPMLDIPMLFFLLLGQILAWEYLQSGKPVYLYGLSASLGLGFLTKGLLPAVLPLLTMCVYIVYILLSRQEMPTGLRNPLKILPRYLVSGIIFFLLISVWLLPQIKIYGAAEFGASLYRENIERFFHPIDETGGYREVSSSTQIDPHLNLLYLWLGFLPWSPLIIPAVHSVCRVQRRRPELVFNLLWFLLVLVLTTVSGHYKGPRYLLPLFPPLSLLCGVFVAQGGLKNYSRLIFHSYLWTGLVFLLVLVALPFVKYTHGEEVYLPIVLPFWFCFTFCLLGGAWRRNPHIILRLALISYVLLFSCAARFLPINFPLPV